ncbi:MAG: YciI family protein [Caulobacteraceae bacterium]
MADYLFLMHGDAPDAGDWSAYLSKLRASGRFQGGSAIGDGVLARKSGDAQSTTALLTGYIRVEADDLAHARTLLSGNPVYEGGGTVEIRELPRD